MTTEPTPFITDATTCRSCGSSLTGKYCTNCGEKAPEPGERSFLNFLGELWGEVSFLDGKFIRTVKLMFTKPGFMSYEYMNGRRVPFIKPMSMFFIANLLYFMFPVFDTFNSSLNTQMNRMPYSDIATEMVHKKIEKEKIDINTFKIQYDQQSENMAKMCLILFVVYLSVPFSLVNYNRKMYFFDHLQITLEISSLILFTIFIVLGWLLILTIKTGFLFGADLGFLVSDTWSTMISIVVLSVIFYMFERNAYSQTVLRAIAKSGALVLSFYFALQLYRASLFLLTIWTV